MSKYCVKNHQHMGGGEILKGIVNVISGDPPSIERHVRLQRYP